MEEIWKDIEGYEGLYQVSNLGRVKSLRYGKERILKLNNNKCGYLIVALYGNGKAKYCKVHRLVAKAFIPNPNNYPIINHKDENPSNNVVENLEWCTYSYNNNYGTRNERISKTNKGNPKLSEAMKGKKQSKGHIEKRAKAKQRTVMAINKESGHIFIFQSIKQASEELKVNYTSISACCLGKLKQCGGYIWEYY